MSIRKKGTRWEVRIRAGAGRRVEQRLPAGANRVDAQALEAALRRRLIAAATGRIDYTIAEAIERWRIDAQRLRSWPKDLRYRADVVLEAVGHYRLERLVEAADVLKARGAKSGLKPAKALDLIRHWIEEEVDADRQAKSLNYLMQELDQDRVAKRRLFEPR